MKDISGIEDEKCPERVFCVWCETFPFCCLAVKGFDKNLVIVGQEE